MVCYGRYKNSRLRSRCAGVRRTPAVESSIVVVVIRPHMAAVSTISGLEHGTFTSRDEDISFGEYTECSCYVDLSRLVPQRLSRTTILLL
jgi:hypothetical protein